MLATTLAGCLLFPTLSQGADVSLTNAAELRSMTSDKADQRTLAVVEGVVTLYNADWGGFTMQDGTGAIWVTGNTKKPLVPGDRVRVHGKSGAGLYTPVIIADSVESLGSESLPAAVSSDAAELFSGRWDATRVRVRGLVGNVSSDDKMVHFQLYSEGYLIEVQSFIGLGHKPERLSEVEITGICTVVAENVRVRGINLNI
ncbi:MAG TPA: hypothetical protein VMF06_02500, partial [Candidatus Limnocylindria bacterium]|nr:hypothetical protein [Candidatus Limnocylindria bacterium]